MMNPGDRKEAIYVQAQASHQARAKEIREESLPASREGNCEVAWHCARVVHCCELSAPRSILCVELAIRSTCKGFTARYRESAARLRAQKRAEAPSLGPPHKERW